MFTEFFPNFRKRLFFHVVESQPLTVSPFDSFERHAKRRLK